VWESETVGYHSAEDAQIAADSALEGDGFELSVPGRETFKLSWETGLLSRKRERICSGTEGSNPSPSSRESTNYRFLSAKPIGSGSAVGKFVQIRDRM